MKYKEAFYVHLLSPCLLCADVYNPKDKEAKQVESACTFVVTKYFRVNVYLLSDALKACALKLVIIAY